MIDRVMLYDILYALAAKDGREAALFDPRDVGEGADARYVPLAREALERSLACDAFPELWFELPLAGEPWFDLHALTAREDLDESCLFTPETTGGFPNVFEWFASQGPAVRQLALSWDVSSGRLESPAVQLLLNDYSLDATCGFLEAVGRPDAKSAYRSFYGRLPKGWFACYTGVFPSRPGHNLRVECIPHQDLQRVYAHDAGLLEEHLRQVGLKVEGDTLVSRCQMLAGMPFQFEFQFDVNADGTAGATFGASLRFASPSDNGMWQQFDPNGAAGELMQRIQEWGLVDDRWRLLADTMFAKRVQRGERICTLYCHPAFVKLRWRDGAPLDAKAYLKAGEEGLSAAESEVGNVREAEGDAAPCCSAESEKERAR